VTRKAPKSAKRPAKPKPVTGYIVVRQMVSENENYTEPDCVFASKGAALKHAKQFNSELRALTNPFAEDSELDWLMTGGEKALLALLKKLAVRVPKEKKGQPYIDWEAWWDDSYFNMTDAQRDAIWDALDAFNWYTVKKTTVE
jgi:hypothetical protein